MTRRRKFTSDEHVLISKLYAEGKSLRAITVHLGTSYSRLLEELAEMGIRARPAWSRGPKRKKIKCLCCKRLFLSEGSHNRMCDVCRKRYSPPVYTIHVPKGD